jgi:hypothetical protein
MEAPALKKCDAPLTRQVILLVSITRKDIRPHVQATHHQASESSSGICIGTEVLNHADSDGGDVL